MQKRLWTLLLPALLVFSLTACGTASQSVTTTRAPDSTVLQTGSPVDEGDIASPAEGSRETQTERGIEPTQASTAAQTTTTSASVEQQGEFGPLYQKFVRDPVSDGEYTISMRQSGVSMVTTVSGQDSALESNMAGVLQIRLINRGGSYYMLMQSTKKYAEMSAEDYAKQADSLQSAALDLSGVHYKSSGSETIAGKTYQTETYEEDGRGRVTYFFTDAGLARARVDKDGKTTEVESFTVRDAADAEMFDIPSDYVKVSDPSQLFVS